MTNLYTKFTDVVNEYVNSVWGVFCSDTPNTEIKSPIQLIDNQPHYRCLYDRQRKIPLAVEEVLNSKKLKTEKGKRRASRRKSWFHEDPKLPKEYQSNLDDYRNTFKTLNLNRGHMAAAGNFRFDQNGMNLSFSLANIVPQNSENNSNLWNTYETWTRYLVDEYDRVRVISGPLFCPNKSEKMGKVHLNHYNFKSIGKNRVHVPTHLYKIVLCEKSGQKNRVSVFKVPNESNPSPKIKLKDFEISLEELERETGLEFCGIKKKEYVDLCRSSKVCSEFSRKEADIHLVESKIDQSSSLADVVYGGAMLKRKHIKLKETKKLKDLTNEKFQSELKRCSSQIKKDGTNVDCWLNLCRLLGISDFSKTNKQFERSVLKAFVSDLSKCEDEISKFRVQAILNNKNKKYHPNPVLRDNKRMFKKIFEI